MADGQIISNGSVGSFYAKTIYDADNDAIQEISTASLLTTRIDEGATYLYLGYALPGASESDPVWRLCRYTLANVSGMLWADGDTDFDNIWANRASKVYS